MAVLGGVSTSGGKGRILGATLAIMVIGYLRYGLGLINASSQIIMIVVGLLLIIAVAIPSFRDSIGNMNWFKNLKQWRQSRKNNLVSIGVGNSEK